MSPNPDSNGFVNNAYVGSNSDLTQVGHGGQLNSNGHIELDINQNQISLTEFRKSANFDDFKLENDFEKEAGDKPPFGPQKECHAIKEDANYEVQTAWAVLRQMSVPFLIAGFGSVFAGIVLNMVTKWDVFVAVSV